MLHTNLTTGEQLEVDLEPAAAAAAAAASAGAQVDTGDWSPQTGTIEAVEALPRPRASATLPPSSTIVSGTNKSVAKTPPPPARQAQERLASQPWAGLPPGERPRAYRSGKQPRDRPTPPSGFAAGSSRPKKWSLGPNRQPPLLAGQRSKLPQQGQPHSTPTTPGVRGSHTPPPLPKGVEWPKDAKAKRVVEMLFRDMERSKKAPLEERRRAYRASCLSWHPDKNRKHEDLAKEVFQFLQALKTWYFA